MVNYSVWRSLIDGSEVLTPVIDDFEDGDMSEYTLASASDKPLDNLITQSTTVKEGSFAGGWSQAGGGSGAGAKATITDGLPRVPSSGDTFRFWNWAERGDHYAWTGFGLSTDTGTISGSSLPYEGYWATIEYETNTIKILSVDASGNKTELASTSVSLSGNTWYESEVRWGSAGTIEFEIFDETGTSLASISASDSTYTDGDIGLAINNGSGVNSDCWWDNIRIVE